MSGNSMKLLYFGIVFEKKVASHMLATLLTSVDKQEQDITMQFVRLNIEVTI